MQIIESDPEDDGAGPGEEKVKMEVKEEPPGQAMDCMQPPPGHVVHGHGPLHAQDMQQASTSYSMDTDISKLEAPTFTTLDRGPSTKMMELSWDHKVNLIGKKVRLFPFSLVK